MKPLEQKRFEQLQRMLNWRLGRETNSARLAEAEALDWAMNVILKCYSDGCCDIQSPPGHHHTNGDTDGITTTSR